MSGRALITARGLGVRHGATQALRDVDFEVRAGEIVTLIGPNGSGKTTLLRALIGAAAPSAGTVTRAKGLRIGYAPQRLALDRTMPMTVARFLALGGGGRTERAAALEEVGAPDIAERQLAALSGGQFQRALLARALLRKPTLLALDEPTQGLDQPGVAAFYALVARVRRTLGCAVLMVSHDLHVVMRESDRVVCLNGHVCCEGAPTIVSASPAYRALFGTEPEGALALYRHAHDHRHDGAEAPGCGHGHGGPVAQAAAQAATAERVD
ncbi:metal ABC transporter ATP-binding protein [Rubrimonas cliftonensis]|uniref:Zinc transport system ATP-binding protein n=1 Tax=Rubrimonas cliftonensis TaxID=89524 RepID=A0A1H3W2K8_9RHOB|nr:metal ABC transporter ATP-binding protein [Rubrimonas cliftonensis]SDZ81269.1 zinc transport system ATP-binding protein [Rubrimonas cliftonensis]